MSYVRRRKKRINPLLIPFAVLLVIVVVLLVILLIPDKDEQPEQGGQEQSSQEQSTTQLVEGGMVQTPYGTLYYPEVWKDSMRVECKELEYGMDVEFYGSVAGTEHWLFTLNFGGSGEIPAGAIETPEGYMMDVTYTLSDYVPDDSWSQEDVDTFCAMQESINDLLQKLREDPKFTE